MSWYSDNDFIKDEKSNIVCVLLPDVKPFYKRIITKAPDAIELIGEFVFRIR